MADRLDLYTKTCFKCSKVITHQYGTSFGMGPGAFDRAYQYAIYGIYDLVRYADEIMRNEPEDTFKERIRTHDLHRTALYVKVLIKQKFNAI